MRAAWLPGSAAVTSCATAVDVRRARAASASRSPRALSIEAFVSSIGRGLLEPANGLPQWLSAMPQCAIAQFAIAREDALERLDGFREPERVQQRDALVEVVLHRGAHEVSNFTLALPI